jgi:hypothetical protein
VTRSSSPTFQVTPLQLTVGGCQREGDRRQ